MYKIACYSGVITFFNNCSYNIVVLSSVL